MTPQRGRFVAYYRVSTNKQGSTGLGLEAQREGVNEWLNSGPWQLVGEFIDIDRADKARRLAAGKIVLETHNGLFVALALGVRVGSMPKNVSKHGANYRRRANPSTRRAIDRCRDGSI
jgi:hypothetical protein